MLAHWIRQEEIKAAREQGRREGYAEAQAEVYAEGYAEGYAKGRAEGYAKGRAEGLAEGRALERKVWQEWRRSLEAWEQRKADAKNAGQQFNEPRPKPPADD